MDECDFQNGVVSISFRSFKKISAPAGNHDVWWRIFYQAKFGYYFDFYRNTYLVIKENGNEIGAELDLVAVT